MPCSAGFHCFCTARPTTCADTAFRRDRKDLQKHAFVGYIDDLLAIHAVRWLDEVIAKPTMSFHSNSIIAQCNAAVSGLGIVLLPTFVAAGVAGLQRILPDIVVRREIWVSIRTEQSHLDAE